MLDMPPVDPVVVANECAIDFKSYIDQYKRVKAVNLSGDNSSEVFEAKRLDAIVREAKIVGSQTGRGKRAKQIIELLDSSKAQSILDSFSFRELMYETNIVPPVITEVGASVSIENDGKNAITTRKSWRIVKPAYITTGAITWRSYLIANYSTGPSPRGIYAFYAPRNAQERSLWMDSYCQGYSTGFESANAAFMSNLNRFRRDYLGMIRFKQLEQSGIVSAPQVRETNIGVVVSDNWTALDKKDIRITVDSKFNKEVSWENSYVKP